MENASKALIIAGAILIAILLISVGMILINSGRNVVDQGDAGMQSQQIQTFNSNFTQFEGTRKGSVVREIVSKVNASNATDDAHQVTLVGGLDAVSKYKTSQSYDIVLHYSKGSGDSIPTGKVLAGPNSVTTEKGYIYAIEIK